MELLGLLFTSHGGKAYVSEKEQDLLCEMITVK